MKKFLAVIAALIIGAAVSQAQTPAPTPSGLTFNQHLSAAFDDFTSGAVSNFVVWGGPSYSDKADQSHKWGGLMLVGYNTPKWDFPLEPYLVPVFGLHYLSGSWYGFSGTVALKADLHPLRMFAGGNQQSWLYQFTLTPNVKGGVGENLSGETFGSFKVPGKAPLDGQGTAAVTGEGVAADVGSIKTLKFGLWFERAQWTTIPGNIYEGGLRAGYSPKGW